MRMIGVKSFLSSNKTPEQGFPTFWFGSFFSAHVLQAYDIGFGS